MAQYYEAVGRRKESTARVRLVGGSGTFTVNDKEAAVYFPRVGDLNDILRSFSGKSKVIRSSGWPKASVQVGSRLRWLARCAVDAPWICSDAVWL